MTDFCVRPGSGAVRAIADVAAGAEIGPADWRDPDMLWRRVIPCRFLLRGKIREVRAVVLRRKMSGRSLSLDRIRGSSGDDDERG